MLSKLSPSYAPPVPPQNRGRLTQGGGQIACDCSQEQSWPYEQHGRHVDDHPPPGGGSFCLWLQPEAKSDHIDLRPQERFLNKAQNQLVNLQEKTWKYACVCDLGGS